jgi:hypothetical protein
MSRPGPAPCVPEALLELEICVQVRGGRLPAEVDHGILRLPVDDRCVEVTTDDLGNVAGRHRLVVDDIACQRWIAVLRIIVAGM